MNIMSAAETRGCRNKERGRSVPSPLPPAACVRYSRITWAGCLVMLLLLPVLASCITAPIEEVREQRYSSMQNVVLLSIDEIESNLVFYHARCGNGHWMKPGKPGEPRQMVWGEWENARRFRVDAWLDFHPMEAGRTQVTAYANAASGGIVNEYMGIIVDPTVCR